MNNYAKLKNGLTTLNLPFFRDNLDSYIELVNSGSKSMVDALYELVSIEL